MADSASSVFPRSEPQALAVLNHAGHEIRFFKGQQWQVTNYALLTYAALAAAPPLIVDCEGVANCACILVNFVCSAVVALAAIGAWLVLRSLDKAHDKELQRMNAARDTLPLVQEIHTKFKLGGLKIRPGRVIWVLRIALVVGAVLAISVNLARVVTLRTAGA
jgi:hypothetical protein